ncbi:hypothetical protein PENSPDRAFT_756417 [Peniophora sp. CONT]|nr:hypothetical protein PENSPDRAFT_756417 [Peniophora sp. CONT]
MSALSKEVSPTLELYQRLNSNSRPLDLTPDASRESSSQGPHSSLRLGDIPVHSYLTAGAYAAPRADEKDLGGKSHGVGRIARRVHGWSWQAFPVGMGTGAVYVALSGLDLSQKLDNWADKTETVFFFLNLLLFVLNVSTLAAQAILYPRQAQRLITDPSKNIFVPLVVLSFATLIIGTINYAVVPGYFHADLAYALFWLYVALAVLVSFPLLMLWFNRPHEISQYTPAWMFLVFPLMLVGVVAFNVLKIMDPLDARTVGVLYTGYFFQGIGTLVTMCYITGFLEGHQANGAFVAVGPPGFTCLALINLGAQARKILPAHNLVSDLAGEVWYAASVLCAFWLFGLAIFLLIFGALPYWFKLHKHLHEILGCWALTFPNVGWIGSLGALADALGVPKLRVVQTVCALMLVGVWAVLAVLTIVAFWRGLILKSHEESVLADTTSKEKSGLPTQGEA